MISNRIRLLFRELGAESGTLGNYGNQRLPKGGCAITRQFRHSFAVLLPYSLALA